MYLAGCISIIIFLLLFYTCPQSISNMVAILDVYYVVSCRKGWTCFDTIHDYLLFDEMGQEVSI